MARILVVDDDGLFRSLMRELLELEGHEVTEAGDGREALALCQDQPFDLFITDILMPERDGLETIKELRRRRPEAKIIAVSGGGLLAPEGYLAVAARLGAQWGLVKPFANEELVEAVRALVSG
ncbi:MAG: response regulator [Thermodesulfobacteriota bacterium]